MHPGKDRKICCRRVCFSVPSPIVPDSIGGSGSLRRVIAQLFGALDISGWKTIAGQRKWRGKDVRVMSQEEDETQHGDTCFWGHGRGLGTVGKVAAAGTSKT